MPVLYPSRRSYCCGSSRHSPYPFFFLFVIPLVSEVAHIMKNLTLSSGSNIGPTKGGCSALCHPSLGSPCPLLSLWHTGGRQANVMLRATSPKVLPFSSQILMISCFPRAFPTTTLWHLYKSRLTTPRPFCPSELEKVPCSYLCTGNSPGFRKLWMAISVTALVLSVFHSHQSVLLYICSVPFLPPELAWERKWTAEWMCSLDWDSKQPFPSHTHFLWLVNSNIDTSKLTLQISLLAS